MEKTWLSAYSSQLLAIEVLKGHGFSRAARCSIRIAALAAEGKCVIENYIPSGAKARIHFLPSGGAAKAAPFQNFSKAADCSHVKARS
jgi:hypothetical protein